MSHAKTSESSIASSGLRRRPWPRPTRVLDRQLDQLDPVLDLDLALARDQPVALARRFHSLSESRRKSSWSIAPSLEITRS